VRYNDNDELELFEVGGVYRTTIPYRERSIGNTFESVSAAHHWVFGGLS
jgi:hypothetical protein